jgi:hypothetical protein
MAQILTVIVVTALRTSRRVATLLVLCISYATVSGCYFTRSKIIDTGLDAGILSGQFGCRSLAESRDLRVSLVKEEPRPNDIVYAFEFDNPPGRTRATARFGKLKSGLHFIEVEGLKPDVFSYSFVTARTPRSFEIALQRQAGASKAESFGLKFDPSGVATIGMLIGSVDATVEFLESLTMADLQTALICRHQPT